MLKFRITNSEMSSDSKELDITSVERQDINVYANESDAKIDPNRKETVSFKILAKDIKPIQYGTHILTETDVKVSNGYNLNGDTISYSYSQNVIVDASSDAENSFIVSIDKEFNLDVSEVQIETRYYVYKLTNSKWEKIYVTWDWIRENTTDFEEYRQWKINEPQSSNYSTNDEYKKAYEIWEESEPSKKIIQLGFDNNGICNIGWGKNRNSILVDDKQNSEYSIFYYENSSWKRIDVLESDFQEIQNNNNLQTINTYDTVEHKLVEMTSDNFYYSRENYLILELNETHYFGEPSVTYEYDENGDIKYTEGLEDIVTKYDYPKIYLYTQNRNNTSLFTEYCKYEIECNVENKSRLIFNYDLLKYYVKRHYIDDTNKEVSKNIEIYERVNILPSAKNTEEGTRILLTIDSHLYSCAVSELPTDVSSTEEETKTLTKNPEVTQNNIYYWVDEGYVDDDVQIIEDALFPHGFNFSGQGLEDLNLQLGSVGNTTLKRDNFMFDELYGAHHFYVNNYSNIINIPILQKFENDLFHNDALQTKFVEHKKNEMISDISDMEKDVYLPAIQVNCGDDQINAEYKDCYKIIFNLHFRQHRNTNTNGQTEEWNCDRDCYWNGTRTITNDRGKKVVDLDGRIYNYNIQNSNKTKQNKYDYFSYFGNIPTYDDGIGNKTFDGDEDYDLESNKYMEIRRERNTLKEYQSDLLSYLGFTNDDVKYQKSKLKKSFLRISFYDSDNIGNQNLLHTSTIFLDSGDLFSKYIKNISIDDEYIVYNGSVENLYTGDVYNNGDTLSKVEFNQLSSEDKKKCIIGGDPMATVGSSITSIKQTTSYYTGEDNSGSGLRINREPMRNSGINIENGDLGDNINELEYLRMSSQIVVTDKYSSKHSSEGFYFYNYKGNDNGVYPSELYMRVEFNHAGYGRTIPFMMPYISENEENLTKDEVGYERYSINYQEENVSKNKETDRGYDSTKTYNKIKTFDDICYDWSELDIDTDMKEKDESNIGYGAVRYMKYCHIKWKYRYDKKTQKHIYYLDPEVYGTGVTYGDDGKTTTGGNGHGNNIILNLYEGKII